MSRRIRVSFAESAILDLEEIIAWYSEQMVPETGERLVKEILSKTEILCAFPESG